MTPIYDGPIEHKMAWRGSDLGGKEALAFDLTARHVEALTDVLARTERAGLAMAEITAAHCRDPALDADLARILDELQHGRGIVLLRGLPFAGFSDEQVAKMSWAIGTHLGTGVSQSAAGDMLGFVRDETPPGGRESARGYLSRRELMLHSDLAPLVGLFCVRQAMEGGRSQVASGLAIHNEIQATRPDLLPILYRGFPYHRRGEAPAHQAPVTGDLPVFTNVDGTLSIFLVRTILDVGLRALGRDYTDAEREALELVAQAGRKVQLDCRLEPGEGFLFNNFTVLHSRTEFVDWPEPAKKRLMLRLWLDDAPNRRPGTERMYIYENAGGRAGIDPLPGGKAAQPDFRADALVEAGRA